MPRKRTAKKAASPKRPRREVSAAVASAKKVSNWSFRVEPNTRRLIDAAAEVLGSSRTDFVVQSARERATEVLLNNRLFLLSSSEWHEVTRVLDNPVPANAKLKALLAMETPW